MSSKVLFINVTRQCNVDCHRCYLTPENRMSPMVLPIEWIEQTLSSSFFAKADNVAIIWQGGEPTLAGKSYFEKACDRAQSILPQARQTMVTNLYNLPNWLIELAGAYFNGAIETTYAAAGKATLDGNEGRFQERFAISLAKAIENGLTVPVNVELNRETALLGPSHIFELSKSTGNRTWEFDISIDFEEFRRSSMFGPGKYPILPSTLPYSDFSNYLLAFSDLNDRLEYEDKLHSSILSTAANKENVSSSFNVLRERDFLTLNPDGTLTTNPLFSDITETYLGSLVNMSIKDILQNIKRTERIRYELERIRPCSYCEFYSQCRGGPSHAPLMDGSGECAGMKNIWHWGAQYA